MEALGKPGAFFIFLFYLKVTETEKMTIALPIAEKISNLDRKPRFQRITS